MIKLWDGVSSCMKRKGQLNVEEYLSTRGGFQFVRLVYDLLFMYKKLKTYFKLIKRSGRGLTYKPFVNPSLWCLSIEVTLTVAALQWVWTFTILYGRHVPMSLSLPHTPQLHTNPYNFPKLQWSTDMARNQVSWKLLLINTILTDFVESFKAIWLTV